MRKEEGRKELTLPDTIKIGVVRVYIVLQACTNASRGNSLLGFSVRECKYGRASPNMISYWSPTPLFLTRTERILL